MNDDQLSQYGDDPLTRHVCEHALQLHHTTSSGPLPYATVLAIAAMCTAGKVPEVAVPEDVESQLNGWSEEAELPYEPPEKPKRKRRGRVNA